MQELPERVGELIGDRFESAPKGEYIHWDKLVHLKPPAGLTSREWWFAIKLQRVGTLKSLPLRDSGGTPFEVGLPDKVLELMHLVDKQAGGRIGVADTINNPTQRDRYLMSSLIEEAITSSQLEGASTTRKVAKEMLRSGRAPKNRSERMIANNYRAMRYVVERRDKALTPGMVCELHRIVTEGTLDNPDAAGRLQTPEDDRVAIYDEEDKLLHTPPAASELVARLDAMCAFANHEDGGGWLHPLVRAITLHFWMGHDHYFEDGNGRTARAIFYWSMLREGYWLTEFLTISAILKKAPSAYAQSFLLAESDENDLTYFLIYHLEVIRRALAALEDYLARKIKEVQEVEALVRVDSGLNHRQRALLGAALRDPASRFTIEGHRRSHDVVYQTARTDLLDLERRGLLIRKSSGNRFVFVAAPDMSDKLRSAP